MSVNRFLFFLYLFLHLTQFTLDTATLCCYATRCTVCNVRCAVLCAVLLCCVVVSVQHC
jgi:hypothetical protein